MADGSEALTTSSVLRWPAYLAILCAALVVGCASSDVGSGGPKPQKNADSVNVKPQEDVEYWAKVKPQTVLKVISMLEADPAGKDAEEAMSIIVNFAQASNDVLVVIIPRYLPWLTRKPKVDNREILLASFVAGNVRAQLQKQIKKNHPAEGLHFMLGVYTKLRAKELIEKIPEC